MIADRRVGSELFQDEIGVITSRAGEFGVQFLAVSISNRRFRLIRARRLT